jgi:ABC-type glutathione transport system ATPase component
VFLKHLVGLLKPDRGSIFIDGKDLPTLSERELYEVRRKFGVLFQDGALFGSLNVYDNVAFPLREHNRKPEREIRGIVNEKLEMVGLKGAEAKFRVHFLPPQQPAATSYEPNRGRVPVQGGHGCRSRYGPGVGPSSQPQDPYVAPGSQLEPGQ